jgi:hypothetical protein
MMYFTEADGCPEDPIALNDAFEAEYDTDEYEAKISKLMHHAHSRIKKENPEAVRKWNEAIQQLSKGDHYILILCNEHLALVPGIAKERPPHDSLKLLGAGILLAAALTGLAFLGAHYGILSSESRKGRFVAPSGSHTLMPLWLQRVLWFLIVGSYLYYVVLPWVLKRPLPGPMSVLSKLFRQKSRSSGRH